MMKCVWVSREMITSTLDFPVTTQYNSRLVFMVFHSSRLVFHGSRLVIEVFHGSRWVLWFFMVPGWFFIFHTKNTLKLYSGLAIQSRPCRP